MEQELLLIIGYAIRTKRLSSLHVARRSGRKLVYAGQVGTGFTAATITALEAKLQKLATASPVAGVPVTTPSDRWVSPILSARIEYRGTSMNGLLRHASFKGLKVERKQ